MTFFDLPSPIYTKNTIVSINEIKFIRRNKTNSKSACNVGLVDDAGVCTTPMLGLAADALASSRER